MEQKKARLNLLWVSVLCLGCGGPSCQRGYNYGYAEYERSYGDGGTSYALEIEVQGGSIRSNQFIDCSPELCRVSRYRYSSTNDYRLTAVPGPGYRFAGWEGLPGCGLDDYCEFQLEEDTYAAAVFVPAELTYLSDIDHHGNPVLAGEFTDSLSVAPERLDSRGNTDVYLLKLDAMDASLLWDVHVGGLKADRLLSLSVDAWGDVTVELSALDVIQIDTPVGPGDYPGCGDQQPTLLHPFHFLLKFSESDGAMLWGICLQD